ncbi:unnamed protein product [Chondrus crispus]|uniref:Uncharacterized protein n=1 Tax=Chondrus crispus TaxID=2769 RepID=R7QEB7_CHOCR|nr:unnamed protein product [Chondrus crispus]CDF36857.1 unnamed protein product [Chondrus crispus]|eukprot:XP_005716676.1 unnamed protein product [Chondrus crispus]
MTSSPCVVAYVQYLAEGVPGHLSREDICKHLNSPAWYYTRVYLDSPSNEVSHLRLHDTYRCRTAAVPSGPPQSCIMLPSRPRLSACLAATL